jgi:hypothetical protein
VNKPIRGPQAGLIVAYRKGLGLAGVAILSDAAGIRITATGPDDDNAAAAKQAVATRWWCRKPVAAERVAAAAMKRMRRHQAVPCTGNPAEMTIPRGEATTDAFLLLAKAAIVSAAGALGVALYADEEVFQAAMAAAARIDLEVERMQRCGELKPVNKSYQTYRIESSARGERVMRYQDWMQRYKENLLCKLTAALRSL